MSRSTTRANDPRKVVSVGFFYIFVGKGLTLSSEVSPPNYLLLCIRRVGLQSALYFRKMTGVFVVDAK